MRLFIAATLVAALFASPMGASVPDVVMPGMRTLNKEMTVDPGKFAKTHFVFSWDGNSLRKVGPQERLRVYLFKQRVYLAPLSQKAAILAAFDYKNHGPKVHEQRMALLKGLPRSKPLEQRSSVKTSSPIHSVRIRYTVDKRAKGELILKTVREEFDRKGKLLERGATEDHTRKRAALLGTLSLGGCALLALLLRRSRQPAAK